MNQYVQHLGEQSVFVWLQLSPCRAAFRRAFHFILTSNLILIFFAFFFLSFGEIILLFSQRKPSRLNDLCRCVVFFFQSRLSFSSLL